MLANIQPERQNDTLPFNNTFNTASTPLDLPMNTFNPVDPNTSGLFGNPAAGGFGNTQGPFDGGSKAVKRSDVQRFAL